MAYKFKLEKVMMIKEKEKEKVFGEYSEAVRAFEQVAEKLYESLKQKEQYVELHHEHLAKGLSVQKIRHFQLFISNIERTISHYQQLVIQARHFMQIKQEKLAEANQEVRKYEIMKEKQIRLFNEELKTIENQQMDEISIQQYVQRGG